MRLVQFSTLMLRTTTSPDNRKIRVPGLNEIRALRPGVLEYARQTPLIRLEQERDDVEIYLKLENLQPGGAFKIRPAAALLRSLSPEELAGGVWTASSGNFGIAAARMAAGLQVPCTVVIPSPAPPAKIERLQRLGAKILPVSPEAWWKSIRTHECEGVEGTFLDAVANPRAQAGSGSIGLEILEQLPEVDTVFVPFGGGGLVCGISAAVKAIHPEVCILACESECAAPLTAALAAGAPVEVPVHPGFISGIGVSSVLPAMWPALQQLVDGTVVVSLAETVAAIRRMALSAAVVAEGAGAVAVAAALSGRTAGCKVACIVSGGNIDANHLATIMAGGVPA